MCICSVTDSWDNSGDGRPDAWDTEGNGWADVIDKDNDGINDDEDPGNALAHYNRPNGAQCACFLKQGFISSS